MKITLWVLVVFTAGCCNADQCLYRSPTHTMCKYPTNAGPSCVDKKPYVFTDADKKKIVDEHNKYRSMVASGKTIPQPKARNMYMVSWDDELATVAQRWVDQCTFRHDDLRDLYNGDLTIQVGQNIDKMSSSKETQQFNISAFIYDWYLEQNNPKRMSSFNPTRISPFVNSPTTGHYTQLVWAQTIKIGCGIAKYKSPELKKAPFTFLFACNYAPKGNMEGQGINLYYPARAPQKESIGDLCEAEPVNGLCPPPKAADTARDIPKKYLP